MLPIALIFGNIGAIGAERDTVVEIYVSVLGDDGNSGLAGNPVRTINRAQEIVRQFNANSDVMVHIGEGTYSVGETISFAAADGGMNGHSVFYKGNNAVISGGRKIEAWTLHDARKNIYKAENVGFDFAQLYVDGQKAVRAKNVAQNDLYSQRIVKAYREETSVNGVVYPKDSVVVEGALVERWNNFKDVKLKVFTAWTDNLLPIESVEFIGGNAALKIQSPCSERIFNRPHPDITGYSSANVTRFVMWFENAYEFIDEQGEWYLDKSTDTLYFKAFENQDMSMAEVIAPYTETLISIKGTIDNPVKNLVFDGITFMHSNWTRPNEEGLVGGQASQYVLTSNLSNEIGIYRIPAAVYGACAENIDFKNNTFCCLGATGLDLHYAIKGGVVEGNVFSDISGNGISVGKFMCDDLKDYHDPYNPSDEREICDGQVIRNNYLTRAGTDYEGSVGIGGGYPRNITIEHNTLSHMPYTGISVGFGWTAADNAMNTNKINANHIHDVNKVVCDGAAIYTLSKQPGSEIRHNYIHDFESRSWFDYGCAGIYLDEKTEGYNVSNNAMFDCPGIWQNRTGSNSLSNNGRLYSPDIILSAGVSEEYRHILPAHELPQMPERAIPMFGWSAQASSTCSGYSTANALDGNANTRWVSGKDQAVGDYFTVDMKMVHKIYKLSFTGRTGDNPDYPADCDIYVSSDGTNWGGNIASVRNNAAETIEVTFEPVEARYIKIVIAKAKKAWWDIRTLYVYDSDDIFYSTADFSAWPISGTGGAVTVVEFDIVPFLDNIDGVVKQTAAENTVNGWGSCGVDMRLFTNGKFEYYDGTAYQTSAVSYKAWGRYHIKMYINAEKKKFSIYCSENGGESVVICEEASFRQSAKSMNSVGKILVRGGSGYPEGQFAVSDYTMKDIRHGERIFEDQGHIVVYGQKEEQVKAFFAVYDSDKLTSAETRDVLLPENGLVKIEAGNPFDKMFLWKSLSTMRPI
ncbi:MAG: discoidin domain-containing protein [Clostridia bacterium]|nr:discoidin domain-containing protein [Clostridia bacterium]